MVEKIVTALIGGVFRVGQRSWLFDSRELAIGDRSSSFSSWYCWGRSEVSLRQGGQMVADVLMILVL